MFWAGFLLLVATGSRAADHTRTASTSVTGGRPGQSCCKDTPGRGTAASARICVLVLACVGLSWGPRGGGVRGGGGHGEARRVRAGCSAPPPPPLLICSKEWVVSLAGGGWGRESEGSCP